jgi:hypothetical protein
MQGIRPTTHPLLVLSLRLTALTTGWGYWYKKLVKIRVSVIMCSERG